MAERALTGVPVIVWAVGLNARPSGSAPAVSPSGSVPPKWLAARFVVRLYVTVPLPGVVGSTAGKLMAGETASPLVRVWSPVGEENAVLSAVEKAGAVFASTVIIKLAVAEPVSASVTVIVTVAAAAAVVGVPVITPVAESITRPAGRVLGLPAEYVSAPFPPLAATCSGSIATFCVYVWSEGAVAVGLASATTVMLNVSVSVSAASVFPSASAAV